MKSPIVKRSIIIAGHKTSVSLEDAFWKGLKEITRARGPTVSELVGATQILMTHTGQSIVSHSIVVVLDHYHSQIRRTGEYKICPRAT